MATASEIRSWLKANGYNPGERGRFRPDHLAAYQAAHGEGYVSAPRVTKAAAVKASTPKTEGDTNNNVGQSLSRAEMETSISYTMEDDVVQIYSSIVRDISRMRKDPNYTEIRSRRVGGSLEAWFTCPVDKFKFGSRKTMNLSEEERARRSARMTGLHS